MLDIANALREIRFDADLYVSKKYFFLKCTLLNPVFFNEIFLMWLITKNLLKCVNHMCLAITVYLRVLHNLLRGQPKLR